MRSYRVRITQSFDLDVKVAPDENGIASNEHAAIVEGITEAFNETIASQKNPSVRVTVEECYDDPELSVIWHAKGAFNKPVLVFDKRRGSAPFTQEQCDEIYDRASTMFEVTGHWNGAPGMTYSISLTDAALPALKEWSGK